MVSPVDRSADLYGQAVTALLAARGDHAAAVLRLHALEEAMNALPAAVMRLVGPLHEEYS